MKTIVGVIWGMLAGAFLAAGIIVFTMLIGTGADLLGFTEYTYIYYVTCLCICIALLIISKPARAYLAFMLLFFVAVVMVMGVGFEAFSDSSSGDVLQAKMLGMAMSVAKIFMYVAPGALTALYAFLAFDGVSQARAQNILN
ncbi:hypothetical protein [Pseudomonas sp. MWU12-2323]|uniref:hypothetical protein n=1 Tax=Pseudomonas sp. MWU12-2323 TaxID=2651296 RepID=UPI00128E7E4A|nr:hypothetical protein [Pseudomonas sp. MWU12-2323]MPQ71489.1 hypothetical protein [Pseudomonas sp. MWU12-2323]